jgi:hypothetical protein
MRTKKGVRSRAQTVRPAIAKRRVTTSWTELMVSRRRRRRAARRLTVTRLRARVRLAVRIRTEPKELTRHLGRARPSEAVLGALPRPPH